MQLSNSSNVVLLQSGCRSSLMLHLCPQCNIRLDLITTKAVDQ